MFVNDIMWVSEWSMIHPMRYLLTNNFDCMPHKFYFTLDTISMQELQLEVIGCQNEMLPIPLIK